MTESTEDIEAITDAVAAKSKTVTTDGVSRTTHDLDQLGRLEDRRANKAVSRGNGIGVRFFKLQSPGMNE